MKKTITPSPPPVWPRSDPAKLAKFDPRTKICHMNCGPSSLDPRSKKERLFQCTDCSVQPLHIITFHIHPPIPQRFYDWRAEYAGGDERGPFGWGATKEEAIADLKDNS